MAVDLMVMPLSRYWAGDFITPAMELGWKLAGAYSVVMPGKTITIPPGVPYGGADAPERRSAMSRDLPGIVASLAIGVDAPTWNEADDEAPFFRRVDPKSLLQVFTDAERNLDSQPSLLSRAFGGKPRASHLAHAIIFLPHDFEAVARYQSVPIGSLPRARAELDEVVWSAGTEPAITDVREAVDVATRRKLPLIIDN